VTAAFERTATAMGTVVTIRLVGGIAAERPMRTQRALDWFSRVEACCSRFDPSSELRRMVHHAGHPFAASEILFEATRFAIAVARASDGAFDPTIGTTMESRGFDISWQSGTRAPSRLPTDAMVSWRDVEIDEAAHTITLHRPLVLDLGAVAKGLAVDLAAAELADTGNFAIDAGGDLYLAGHNTNDEPWTVGVRHPRNPSDEVARLRISNAAVCTSGDYERSAPLGNGHHIVDPRLVSSAARAASVASVTVVAPRAMVADALGTAAFVLGPERGIDFLEHQGVDGMIVTPDLARTVSRGMRQYFDTADVTTA
jgi:thiamine biosynthesis lipoprotein